MFLFKAEDGMEAELDKVIDELAKIDSAAAEYAKNMEGNKARLMDEYQKAREDYAAGVRAEAEARNEQFASELSGANKKQIDRLSKKSDAYISRITDAYEANHTRWAKEIADRIISGK